jgi:AcrR family transcriptional regulator
MPRAFSASEKEIIQRRLLEQGYRLFSVHGLKKTNVDELAAAAGISKGAFYSFYESKEALFMDVIEQAEAQLRVEILAAVELPGPTPRARLTALLGKAFDTVRSMPILQVFSSSDFDLLFWHLPESNLQEHLASDAVFMAELIARCNAAGIAITALPEQIFALLYPLVLYILRGDELSREAFPGSHGHNFSLDLLLELAAAFCLGEITLEAAQRGNK